MKTGAGDQKLKDGSKRERCVLYNRHCDQPGIISSLQAAVAD